MALAVTSLDAVEILDSRARPTLAVTITLAEGTSARGRGALGRLDGITRGRRAAGR